MYWLVLAASLGASWNDVPNRTLLVDTDIVTKQYIQVKLPDQTYLEVPVVNGWLPAISCVTDPNGSPRLIFNYRGRYPAAAGPFKYVREQDYVPPNPPALPPAPIPQTVPSQFHNNPAVSSPPARQFMGSWGTTPPPVLEMKQPSEVP